MIFSETNLSGAFIIDIEKVNDERGFFARIWDTSEFTKMGLNSEFVQSSISLNYKKGTIRGMHYQVKPYEEEKLVRCVKGKIFDVIIDLRSNSKTFKKWYSIELNSKDYKMVFIPKGFAHGFQTLENNTEVVYHITQYYNSKYSRGIRWDDKTFKIKWPLEVSKISKNDLSNPVFSQTQFLKNVN